MEKAMSLCAVAEILVLFMFDVRKNGGVRKVAGSIIRIMAGPAGGALLLLALFLTPSYSMSDLLSDLVFPVAMLSVSPCSYEKHNLAVSTSGILLSVLAMSLLLSVLFPFERLGGMNLGGLAMSSSFVVVCLSVHLHIALRRKVRSIRKLMKPTAAWFSIEDFCRFIYQLMFSGLLTLSICSFMVKAKPFNVAAPLLCTLLLMILYALLYLRSMTGQTFLITVSAEKRIKGLIQENSQADTASRSIENMRMNVLYGRVLKYMSEQKPFLRASFDLSDFCTLIGTNKLYLSRTINQKSGLNFRQFLNYHRVSYALDLLVKDRRIKMSEVAELSGFNSSASFNLAFRIHTGKTPTQWLEDYRDAKRSGKTVSRAGSPGQKEDVQSGDRRVKPVVGKPPDEGH